MIEIFNKNSILNIKINQNQYIYIDKDKKEIKINDLDINFPGEYEKSGILAEVKEFDKKLFYSFLINGKVIFVIFYDDFELKEEIMSFFGDVDILIINSLKNSLKIIENIEAKVVIPFGEGKDLLLNSIGQNKEEIEVFKLKFELPSENTEFINLK